MNLAKEAQRHVRAIEKDYMESIEDSVNKTRNLSPNDLKGLVAYLYDEQRKPVTDDPRVELINESIDDWIRANVSSEGKICVVNFASYKNPGGDFMDGGSEREAVICHATNLYNVLSRFKETYYGFNCEHFNSGLYTSNMLFTPDIEVYWSYYGNPLGKVDVMSISAPAAYVLKYRGISQSNADKVVDERVRYMFAVAAACKEDVLVLGDFGCESLGNDPYIVASVIKHHTKAYGKYFKRVVCVVSKDKNYNIFDKIINGN